MTTQTTGGADRPPSWLRRVFAMVGVVAALAVVGLIADILGIVGFVTGKTGPELVAPAPAPASAGTGRPAQSFAVPVPSPTAPAAPESPSPSPSPSGGPEIGKVYAADLDLLNQASDVDVGPAEIKGEHYGHSIVFRCSLYCDSPEGVVEFNLGGRYETFEATVGVLDDAEDAEQVGHFEVFVDGSSAKSLTATLGKPRSIKIDLPADAMRLKLLAYRPDTVKSPLMAGANAAGGRSNGLPELAWGNPRLTGPSD